MSTSAEFYAAAHRDLRTARQLKAVGGLNCSVAAFVAGAREHRETARLLRRCGR